MREKVWQDSSGVVVKYNLAYINHVVCRLDNGRVLGYDNNHHHHHRHFMGAVEPVEWKGYERMASSFYEEVKELWRKEDESDS